MILLGFQQVHPGRLFALFFLFLQLFPFLAGKPRLLGFFREVALRSFIVPNLVTSSSLIWWYIWLARETAHSGFLCRFAWPIRMKLGFPAFSPLVLMVAFYYKPFERARSLLRGLFPQKQQEHGYGRPLFQDHLQCQ